MDIFYFLINGDSIVAQSVCFIGLKPSSGNSCFIDILMLANKKF